MSGKTGGRNEGEKYVPSLHPSNSFLIASRKKYTTKYIHKNRKLFLTSRHPPTSHFREPREKAFHIILKAPLKRKLSCVCLADIVYGGKQKFIYCEKASGVEHKKYCTQFLLLLHSLPQKYNQPLHTLRDDGRVQASTVEKKLQEKTI